MDAEQVALARYFADSVDKLGALRIRDPQPAMSAPVVREISGEAYDEAERRTLACLDIIGDTLGYACSGRNDASHEIDWALRMPHRIEETDIASVLGAVLLTAHENNAEECLRTARELVRRLLAEHKSYTLRLASEMEL